MDINTGIAQDPRSELEKAQDIQHEEIASGLTVVTWVEKAPEDWKKYSKRDQDGSFSCLAQSGAKALEILKTGIQSAQPIYRSRANFPGEGMWLGNVASIINNPGTTTEAIAPSQFMNETQMNALITKPTFTNNFIPVNVNPKNIDALAFAIENYKHVMLVVYGSTAEWNDRPVFNQNNPQNFNHGVCAVDYFMHNGEKCILIEDSHGLGTSINNSGQRIITEAYLKARFVAGMYLIPKQKPKHVFTSPLNYGLMGNSDVIILQDILKYEGFFPKEINSTGNFLQVTANALKTWQISHGITDFQYESDLRKIRCGMKSIAILNVIYGG